MGVRNARNLGSEVLEQAWVVTSVSPTRIEGTENGKPLALTPDLSIIEFAAGKAF